jgi:hypothetical protein
MSDKPKIKFSKRKILIWIVRIIYISVLMAAIDSWTGYRYGHPIFSMTVAGWRDGGTTMTIGPGYGIRFWRPMDGSAYGPVIWFYFTPFVIDAAHRGITIHWLWSDMP